MRLWVKCNCFWLRLISGDYHKKYEHFDSIMLPPSLPSPIVATMSPAHTMHCAATNNKWNINKWVVWLNKYCCVLWRLRRLKLNCKRGKITSHNHFWRTNRLAGSFFYFGEYISIAFKWNWTRLIEGLDLWPTLDSVGVAWLTLLFETVRKIFL